MNDLLDQLTAMQARAGSIMVRLDLAEKRAQITRLQKETVGPDFWNDSQAAQAKMQRLSALQAEVSAWEDLQHEIANARELVELSLDGATADEQAELVADVESLAARLQHMEFLVLLSGPHDADDAVLSISAGAGGTESQDWVEMLLRMYLRWAEANRHKAEILDQLEGDGAGLKNVTVLIQGEYVYGYLKAERGVHRLVRISPFDASNRRHTSFALVEVSPDIKEEIDIQINPDDLEIDVYRSSGAGGQHVQKNATAVRIKHLPSGLVVTCQNQRSQLQNRETALRILRGRLYDLEQERLAEEQARLKGEHVEAGWGNQIRSYVLHPYKMVKDHRTGHEAGNAEGVLDGKIDDFIEAFLQYSVGQH
ncbi:MAG: peptide chain release factor 2 [Anaerolineae bacterium]